MANQWFRLYSEFATDPKVQMMSEADQRRFIMVLCLRCSNDDVTLHDDEVAFQLRISEDEWARSKLIFLQKGLIKDDNTPTAWERRQFVSDSSAERVRRHRANKKNIDKQPCNVTETPPEAEADTDTESDTEKAVLKRASTDLTVVAPDPSEQLALSNPPVEAISEDPQAPTTTRQGAICQQLRAGGMSDAAPSYLDPDTWERILALRTDGEIVELALAKMRDRPGKRTGLKYVAPILLDPPQRIAGPPAGARASPVAKSDALRAHNRAAFAEAKAAIFAREQKHAVE